jgi:glutathione-regulated potassium-efflux system ancillary protein KefC
MDNHSILFDSLIYLSAAVVAVPLAKRLGLGSVLGYLLAGVAIGPWGMQLVTDSQAILHFAEFGVVLLLFLIGLELHPKRLWSMRKPILGLGGSQVLITMLLITIVGVGFGLSWQTALIAGMGLSLSSTAIALQTMTEKNLLATTTGNSGFSILLLQDIAVIPMLALIPALGVTTVSSSADGTGWLDVVIVLAVMVAIIVVGRFLTRPLFRLIAGANSREIFTAFSLLLVIGIAMIMQSIDMSMALGSFMAGVLLAESEYRHQLESDIEPFKGLLLGLFFIAVGMSVDFGLLLANPWLVIGLTAGLIALKSVVLLLLARLFKLPVSQHALFAFVLSQGGEFAFVLFGVATGFAAMPQELADLLIVVVAFSMLTTPLLLIINERFIEPRFANIDTPADTVPEDMEPQDNPVVIAGFGRFGQIVGRLLHANKIGTTIIDHNPNQIERLRQFGFKVFYGEASRLDLLHAAGLQHARLFVLATDDRESGLHTVDLVRKHFPHVRILARAWDLIHVYQLKDHGVQVIERETFDSALRLGESALVGLGYERHRAHRAAQRFRAYDNQLIEELYQVHHDQSQVISISRQARDEIERLLQEDETVISSKNDSRGW